MSVLGEARAQIGIALQSGDRISQRRRVARGARPQMLPAHERLADAGTVGGQHRTGDRERIEYLVRDDAERARIARAIQEQQSAITRIQEGVTQMKGASDQIARGMEEQVQANREFNRGLAERETQVLAIEQATSLQQATAQEVFSHFGVSEQRLRKNAERAKATLEIISSLETLADQLRDQAQNFKN
jgi:methyl-accepting chemotaxis protein